MARETKPWLGVVLAGGRSTRMGVAKADILWRGSTFLERAQTLLQSAGAADVWVQGRTNVAGGLADEICDGGPASAVQSVLFRAWEASYESLVVVPVDMPTLTSDEVQQLRDMMLRHVTLHPTRPTAKSPTPQDTSSDLCWGAHFEGSPLPMALWLGEGSPLHEAPRGQARWRSMYDLGRAFGCRRISGYPHIGSSVNTPRDLEILKEPSRSVTGE